MDRRKQLLYEMKEVRRTRALQRAARKRHGGANGQGIATVAVVGYTNAVGGQKSNRSISIIYRSNAITYFLFTAILSSFPGEINMS